MGIKKTIRQIVYSTFESRYRKHSVALESKNIHGLHLSELNTEEQKVVRNLWGIKDYTYHKLFKTLATFDQRYVSDGVFLPRILRALNPKELAMVFEEKNLYSIIYSQIPQPKSIVSCIRGVCAIDGKSVDYNDALEHLKTYSGFIIKPTHDSTQGNNVRFIRPSEVDVKSILLSYGDNFITQEKLSQSPLTSVFNNTSLNSFRISTLNINGRASLCNILFRCGQNGAVVDNGGAGGLMCGVSPEGRFHSFAYDKFYNRYETTKEGVRFEGHVIPFMKDIVNLTLKWHTDYLPHLGFAGWDIALDENNNPVMIEVNLRWPGIQFEQLCSETPLFGDRTEEVIEFVKTHPLRIMDVISY